MDSRIKAFCEYLNHSHSPYHAQANLARELDRPGYTRLREGEEWALQPGGNYYVCRGNAALIGFRVPEKAPRGFLLSAAHTDRPSFKLKENGEKTGPCPWRGGCWWRRRREPPAVYWILTGICC